MKPSPGGCDEAGNTCVVRKLLPLNLGSPEKGKKIIIKLGQSSMKGKIKYEHTNGHMCQSRPEATQRSNIK